MNYEESYRRSLQHPEEFWGEQARQIHWFGQPEKVLTQDAAGSFRWFRGGRLNTAYLALDFHVDQGNGERTALIYDSPVTETRLTFTYRELRDRVARCAGVLRELGVNQGDTVVIYMPMIPETIIGMLACARIGAVHCVVFGGFAAHELAIRIDDTRPKLLLTASGAIETNHVVDYGRIVEEALAQTEHSPQQCVVLQRPFHTVALKPGRDRDWQEVNDSAAPVDCVEVSATDPLYVLYTSGTTGRPKGILRDNGGHAVAMKFSMSSIYGVEPGEAFWAASDVGWVVGHSYIVYGPLIHGCTTVLYEGKPVRTPDAGAFWRVVSEHRVRSMFAAPTAIRAIKREDPEGLLARDYDTRCLRYLFLAGERCDASTLQWTQQLLHVPVIDHWWQTESGWPMIANMAGIELLPVRPGSAAKPVCGFDVHILHGEGREALPGEEGIVAVRLPLPPGCLPGLWNNPERFQQSYFSTFPGYFFSGDGGYQDEDGYFYITGRIDDIINVAGHRLSTATIEEVIASHPAIAELAVVGAADALKGQVPIGFVVLRSDARIGEDALQAELVELVRDNVGPVASFKRVLVVGRLPKTRSGKILRRTIRCLVDGEPFQTPSTIENPQVLRELRETMLANGLA